jgi:pyruvate formate lyase activating enzyme
MMKVGLQKTSLIDYPGKVGCVVFIQGCNFRCPYCHNPNLVNPRESQDTFISEKVACDFLKSRRDLLDGVVISGGEPCIHGDLIILCEKIKKIGYPIKLDTNGSRPQVIKRLIAEGFLDYIAMDVKTDPCQYRPVITRRYDPGRILLSIQLIMESNLSYEFRTTCVRPIVSEKSVEAIARTIKGARRYVLQRFSHHKVLRPDYFKGIGSGYEEDELSNLRSVAEPWVQECTIR